MIPNVEKEGWHYFAVKKISALLHRITPKHKGDYYCLSCIRSFRKENKLHLMKRYVKINFFAEFRCHPKRII